MTTRDTDPVPPPASPAGELPDDMRVPLHELQADVDWLCARLRTADDEEAGMLKDSIRNRLSQIESAAYRMLPATPPAPAATDEEVARMVERLQASLKAIGKLPICPDWTYSAIRHAQRNCDFDVNFDAGFHEPDRQCGDDIARIVNAAPEIADLLARVATERDEWQDRATSADLNLVAKLAEAYTKQEAAEAALEKAREALRWYADQMCEHSPHYEGCGKLPADDCAGCPARAALAAMGGGDERI